MLCLAQAHIPAWSFQIATVERLCEHLRHARIRKGAVPLARHTRMGFEEPFYFGLRIETARGVAFQRFFDHGCQRLLPHQHLAAPRHTLIAIAPRSLEHPVAIENPRPHPIAGLFAVLLPLVL